MNLSRIAITVVGLSGLPDDHSALRG